MRVRFREDEMQPTHSSANGPHFRSLAIQHCRGMIAQITRAEQCNPGCTGEALNLARAALEALQRGFKTPLKFTTIDPSADVR